MREYFEFTGCAFYGLILIAIVFANDKSFRTPFWIFFISGGVYGIYCVLTYDIKWSWNMPTSVIQRATSTISALGHTIAKFYVVLNRYSVLRSRSLSDNDWKRSWIAAMLVAQLVIPCLAAIPFAFAQPTGIGNGYGPPYLANIVQVISAVIYGAYVISGFILTILAMRKLRMLLNTASEKRKITAAKQEVMITIYSSALFVSHSLKCIQQILFAVCQDDLCTITLTLYPYINDFAVFSSPVLMLIISSKLRRLIISYFRPSAWRTKTTTVAPFSISTTRF